MRNHEGPDHDLAREVTGHPARAAGRSCSLTQSGMEAKSVRSLLLLIVLQSGLWPQTSQTPLPILPAGTLVRLRMTQSLDSTHAGSTVTLEAMRNVRVGDLLVIAKHAPATAHFTAQPAKRGLRPGSLRLLVDSVQDITGNNIAIIGSTKGTIDPRKRDDAVRDTLQTGLIAGFFLKGSEAALPKGAEIDAVVSKDINLDPAVLKQRMATLDTEAAATREQSRTGKATVEFYFYPEPQRVRFQKGTLRRDSQVVWVDGNKLVKLVVGQAYETHITPGHHVVACHGHDLPLDLVADARYYIRIAPSTNWAPTLREAESGEDEVYPLMRPPATNVYAAIQ